MKARISLSSRIFVLAFINLLLLAGVFIVFARFQFHIEFHSFLFAPAQDRVLAVARDLALDLEQIPDAARTGLMGRYSHNYGVDFYLFDNDGPQLAGRPVTLPGQVMEQLRRRRPEDRGRGPGPRPPPPRGDRPPPGEDAPPPPPGQGMPEDDGPPGVRRAGIFQVEAGSLYWVGARIPVPEAGSGEARHGTLIMAAPSFYGTPLFFDYKPWLAALAAVIAIFLLCWLPFIRGLTRTISRVTRATEQIAEGQFDRPLPEDRGDELGQLSAAINRMAARLTGFVVGQKRFLGDIAHELCAPIARIQFGLGILEQRAVENQRGAVEDVQDEMRQMSSLVAELLSFSKAGMEAKVRPLATVDVMAITRQAVDREAPNDHRVTVEPGEPRLAMADPEYLLRAVSNLVRNAVRYAGEAGPITLSARRDNQEVVITVSDCGPGLPPDEIDRVFSPFYRLEASRNRESGGVGLGLAIVKSCVEASRGRVVCRNRQPSGLEVELRFAAA